METVWARQLDFVFILYGAAFLVMAVMADTLRRAPPARLAWLWLQAFGIVHGLHEWMEGMALALGDAPLFRRVRLVMLAISFLLLLEFGRRRAERPPLFRAPWLMVFILMAAAGLYGDRPFAIRYFLGFPAALLAAAAFWDEARRDGAAARCLRGAGLVTACYAALTGLIVPEDVLGPARLLNDHSFLSATGIPVQVLRLACVSGLAGCLWWLSLRPLGGKDALVPQHLPALRMRGGLLLLLLMTGVGWTITEGLGRHAEAAMRRRLLERARTVAASLNVETLAQLSGDPAQEFAGPHRKVVRVLSEVRRISPDLRRIYLFAHRDGQVVYFACSMTDQPGDYYVPGQAENATEEERKLFSDGEACLRGPFTDRRGRWIAAAAPALWTEEGGAVQLALGLELPFAVLEQERQVNRAVGLALTMMLLVLVIDFIARQRRLWLVNLRLAGSEASLRNLSRELEAKVAQRAAELESANRALRAEVEAHARMELKFRTLTDQLPAITYTVSLRPAPHTIFISPQIADLLGYTPEEWLADPALWTRTLHQEDRDMVLREVEGKNRTGEPFDLEYRHVARDGKVRWFRNTARFQFDAEGRPENIHGVMLDITDRVLAAQELRETSERYHLLFEYAPVGVFHYDRDMVLTRCNRRLSEILQSDEARLIGLHLRSLRDPSVLPALEAVWSGGMGYYEGLYRATTSAAETWICLRTAPILDRHRQPSGGVGIVEEISERRRLEDERIKSQKLESLGLLAGGIAHDFNNILTSILGNISLLRLAGATDRPEHLELLREAESATQRAKDLTQQLLTFAKGGAPVKQTVRLEPILRETTSFALRGSASYCQLQVADDLWAADIDPGQIGQVVQNLMINADQSMPDGGLITVRAENVRLREQERSGLPAGPYVAIHIIDRGMGIPAQHLTRIFDPYFTTKSKGSGLGLTTSFSIVHKHGGHIAVASEVGRGSHFTVYLPAREDAKGEPPDSRGAGGSLAATPCRERVLVMDDERAIRDLVKRIMERAGYAVETTAHGEEALAVFQKAREEGRPFAVVILDLTTPGGMGGRETFLRLRALDPDVRALVASGYSDETLAESRSIGFAGVLPKPFTAAELLKAVHAIRPPPSENSR